MNQEKEKESLQQQIINEKKALLQKYKGKYEQIKYQIQKTLNKNTMLTQSIQKECQILQNQLKSTLEKMKQIKNKYIESITQQKIHPEIINIQQLSQYLRSQKELLKKITSQQFKPPQRENNHLKILLAKTKYQQTLRTLKKIQLQEEIKYIQRNILIKNNNLIYNPATSLTISPTQQRQLNTKISNGLEQLQRVITLSVVGKEQHGGDDSYKLEILNSQENRLKECQNIITMEYSKAEQFIRFNNYQVYQLGKHLPVYTPLEDQEGQQQSEEEGQGEKKESKVQYDISQDDIDRILNFPEIPQITISFTHPFNEFEEKLNDLRKKIKKIQRNI